MATCRARLEERRLGEKIDRLEGVLRHLARLWASHHARLRLPGARPPAELAAEIEGILRRFA